MMIGYIGLSTKYKFKVGWIKSQLFILSIIIYLIFLPVMNKWGCITTFASISDSA